MKASVTHKLNESLQRDTCSWWHRGTAGEPFSCHSPIGFLLRVIGHSTEIQPQWGAECSEKLPPATRSHIGSHRSFLKDNLDLYRFSCIGLGKLWETDVLFLATERNSHTVMSGWTRDKRSSFVSHLSLTRLYFLRTLHCNEGTTLLPLHLSRSVSLHHVWLLTVCESKDCPC